MKCFKKALAICAVALVLSSLSAVPAFAASADQNTDGVQAAPSFRLPNGMTGKYEAVENELGGIDYVFPENVPEIRGNSKGITATPVLRPDLRTPTDTQMIFDENEKTTENTQPTATEVIEAVQNMMRSIAFEKENYGLASVDLSKIKLTSKIPAYEVREEGLVPLDTMDFYAITDESGTIVMMISASSEEDETHVSTSGSLVSELLKYQQAHKEVALLYDDIGAYCWDGTSVTLLKDNSAHGNIPGRARLSTVKSKEYANIQTIQLSPVDEIGIVYDPDSPVWTSDRTPRSSAKQVINSQHQTYIMDRKYNVWSTLYDRTESRYDSAVFVTTDSTFPVYTIGLAPRMYNKNNQIISTGSTELLFNTMAGRNDMVFTNTADYPDSNVQAGGDIAIYDGTEYIYQSIPYTGLTSATSSSLEKADLTKGLTKDEKYPVNKKGETYGSELQAEIVGSKPDLIAAVGTKGENGYVRKSDINPVMKTPKEAAAYMKKIASGSHKIPLYNAEGKKIGEFQFSSTKQPAKSVIQDELKIAKAQQQIAEIGFYGYPVNKKGETYGPELEGVDKKPDLIAVSTSDGKSGYALKEDLNGPFIHTPEEAAEYMKNRPASRTIPVFDAEHEKQIGEFVIDGGTSSQAEIQTRLSETEK